jgi:hypothetical protein
LQNVTNPKLHPYHGMVDIDPGGLYYHEMEGVLYHGMEEEGWGEGRPPTMVW